MKRCASCKLDLPPSSFTADPRMKSGLKSYCRDCCRLDAGRRRAANPQGYRAYQNAYRKSVYTTEWRRDQAIRKYGLTRADYDAMLAAQEGCCAICRADRPGGKGDWHIDHDHETGRVRALLCANCNVGIGMFGHDPARLLAAITYLEHHSGVLT